MLLQNIFNQSKIYFPHLSIKYEDHDLLIKLINRSWFFSYLLTYRAIICYPSLKYTKTRPIASSVVLLHNLVRLYHFQSLSRCNFIFLYIFPQLICLLSIILIFLVSWKFVLLFCLICVSNFYEYSLRKREYLSSLYVLNKLGHRMNFDPNLNLNKDLFYDQLKYSIFSFNLKEELECALSKINSNARPYEDEVFDILDDIIIKTTK